MEETGRIEEMVDVVVNVTICNTMDNVSSDMLRRAAELPVSAHCTVKGACMPCTTLSAQSNTPLTNMLLLTSTSSARYHYLTLGHDSDGATSFQSRTTEYMPRFAAVAVYKMLATYIDSYFAYPTVGLRDPLLVQHQLMNSWTETLPLTISQLLSTYCLLELLPT
jgi:hypothetical protein